MDNPYGRKMMAQLSTRDHERIRAAIDQYGRGLHGEKGDAQNQAYQRGIEQRRIIDRIESSTKKERPYGRDR